MSNEIKDIEYKNLVESQINEIISSLNFKDPNSIDWNIVQNQLKDICGVTPSVMPKWTKEKTLNEDLKLDGSNPITEKIVELNIAYLINNGNDSNGNPILIPVNLKYMI